MSQVNFLLPLKYSKTIVRNVRFTHTTVTGLTARARVDGWCSGREQGNVGQQHVAAGPAAAPRGPRK